MSASRGRILALVEQNKPLTDILVIDSHTHLGLSAWNYVPWPDAGGLLVSMDLLGIDKICASSWLALFNDYERGNDEVIQATRDYPDRFVGYAVINPHYVDYAEAELERCFQAPGMKGIKIHPASYVHDYPINGPNYGPVWKFAAEHGCPVLTHAGPRTERHNCGPHLIAEVARSNSGVNIIIAHCGSYDAWDSLDEHIDIVEKYDNLHVDISGMARLCGVVEYLVQRLGADRVLFGSDATDLSFEAEFGHVVYARITDKDKEKILGLNAAKLLRLQPEVRNHERAIDNKES